MNNEKLYTIKLNKSQLETLVSATEVFCRLGIGQFVFALDWLPFVKGNHISHEDKLYFSERLAPLMVHQIDGYRSSLGIYGEETPEFAKIAWDLHQVFRHRLELERAVEKGDEPLRASKEPLASIK